MSKLVFTILAALLLLKMELRAQSTFATSIISSGSTISCSSLTLTASTFSNTWVQKSNFGGGSMASAVSFSIGSKGYIGTGFNGANTNSFWEYDPATDAWTQMADFGSVPRANAVGFSIGNKGYIGTGGGSTTSNYNDFWEFDQISNTWNLKAYFTGGPRINAVGFSIGNKGYIGTGQAFINGTTVYYKDFWEYDPVTDIWTQKADVGGTIRFRASGFSTGGKGYIGLGNDSFSYLNDFWEYDPATNSWLQKTNFAGGVRESAVGLNIACKGYISLGYDGLYKNDFWEYNPLTDNWTQLINFPAASRSMATGFSIGAKAYIGTGFNGSYQNDFWEYNPAVNYLWSNGVTTQTTVANISGAYSVTVTLPDCGTATASKSVTINQAPVISVNSESLCSGNSTVLSATVNSSSGITYSWLPTSSNNSSITVSPTSNTNYTVVASNGGCSSSAVSSVTVYPSTTAVTDFSYASPICINSSNPQPILASGFTPNGIFSSAPGLSIDPNTGLIDLNSSTAGSYVVTYSIAANSCMPASSHTASIVINALTSAVTNFSYTLPLCVLDEDPLPHLVSNFTSGGNFTGTNGLSIAAPTGMIDLGSSAIGTHTVTYAVNASNCVMAGTHSATVTIFSNPTITVNSPPTIAPGDSVELIAASSAGTYTWSPAINLSCSICDNPFASPLETTTYCIRTRDEVTCTYTACVTVTVKIPCFDEVEIAFPNAFSPNGDGSNDRFCIQGKGSCIKSFTMMIFDRWGEKVFETSDANFCWDGTYNGITLRPDVFVYYIKGLYHNNKDFIKKGNITLIK